MTSIELSASSSIQANDASSGSIKTYANLALHHLFAASRSAGRIAQIEKEYESAPFGPFWEEILQNSLGVATLTVAGLESYANELYFEKTGLLHVLNPATTEIIAPLIDKEQTVRKFDLILALHKGKRIPHQDNVVQNIDVLIKLRNAIVHFRPESSSELDKHDKLSKHLNKRFDRSPFILDEPMFPRAWASGKFAVWALESAINFLDYFYRAVDMNNPIESHHVRLLEYARGSTTSSLEDL